MYLAVPTNERLLWLQSGVFYVYSRLSCLLLDINNPQELHVTHFCMIMRSLWKCRFTVDIYCREYLARETLEDGKVPPMIIYITLKTLVYLQSRYFALRDKAGLLFAFAKSMDWSRRKVFFTILDAKFTTVLNECNFFIYTSIKNGNSFILFKHNFHLFFMIL